METHFILNLLTLMTTLQVYTSTVLVVGVLHKVSLACEQSLPAQSAPVWGDVDAAVRQVGGDGHKLVDEARSPHQPEGVHQLEVVADHTQDITWKKTGLNVYFHCYL